MKALLIRLCVSLAVVAAAVGSALAMGGVARATALDCQQYLEGQGYVVGEGAVAACAVGETETEWWHVECEYQLILEGVTAEDAIEACALAAS